MAHPPVIDVHAHALLMGVMGACGDAGPETGVRDGVTFLRAGSQVIRSLDFVESPLSNPDRRLALMERMGIDHQVLSPMPMFYFYDQPADVAVRFARLHNDEMAALAGAYPERLSGLATLPMQDPPAAAAELKRAVNELGLSGAQIGQGAADTALSSPANEIIWEACEDLGAPLVVHPEPLAGGARHDAAGASNDWDLNMVAGLPGLEFRVIAELVFSGILDRHPGLNVIVPNGGGSAPFNRGRLAMALERRPWGKGLLQRPLDDIWKQIWLDCLVNGDDALRFLIEAIGADRVVLGTNSAAWDQADDIVERVRSLGLPSSDVDQVLSGNAADLFGVANATAPLDRTKRG